MKCAWLMLVAIGLSGCSTAGLFGAGKPDTKGADRSVAHYGGLKFGPLSDEGAGLLGGNARVAVPMAAPEAAGSYSETDLARPNGQGATKAVPGPMPAPLPSVLLGSSYMSGPMGPMKLDTVTEAKAPGAQASLKRVIERVVRPVLNDWATDAALVSTSGNSGADGQGPPSGTFGWSLSYVSPSHQEGMAFFVSSEETRVLYLRWEPITIDSDAIKVDSAEAILTVQAAVKDPGIKSREEQDGQDFYLKLFGGSSAGGMGIAPNVGVAVPMPAPAPDPANPTVSPEPKTAPTPVPLQPEATTEILPDLPAGGNWSMQLSPVGDYLVWQLFYEAPGASGGTGMRYPPQAGDSYSYSNTSVSAMVDARTGELLRIQRPTKTTVKWVTASAPMARTTPVPAR